MSAAALIVCCSTSPSVWAQDVRPDPFRMPAHVAQGLSPEARLAALSEDSDKTLAAKHFDPAWVRMLDQRGEPTVYTRANSADFEYIGMPIGGICAGQLYLGGDGKLWCWDIFNTKSMRDTRSIHSYRSPYQRSNSEEKAHHRLKQGFALRVEVDGRRITRTLDRDGFKRISFRGEYPIGYVTYAEKTLPLRVELEAMSPFIPLDLDNSTCPATIMAFTVENTGTRELSGELLGWLENAVCIKSRAQRAGILQNRIEPGPGWTLLSCTAAPPERPSDRESERPDVLFEDFEGDLDAWTVEGEAFEGNPRPNFHHQPLQGFQGKGLADSFRNHGERNALAGPSDAPTGRLVSKPFTIQRRAIRFLIGGGDHTGKTCLNLVVDGKVVQSATGQRSEMLRPGVFRVEGLEGREAHLEIVDQHSAGWGHILVDQIVFTDRVQVAPAPLDDLVDFGSLALALLGSSEGVEAAAAFEPPDGQIGGEKTAAGSFDQPSPVGCLGRRFSLGPGEKTSVRFVLSWYFPHTPRLPISTAQGRHYGTRFKSAAEVAGHIARHYEKLVSQTRLWHDTWYDSTLPYWFLDRTFLNTSVLATNTCYLLRDGRFYGYEGVYHGHGTCTHVWGYVQAPGRLFPEIERRLREMVDYRDGVGFDAQTGRIFYRGETSHGDAVDGQSGCILRTCLAHQMQTDDAFLRRVYPAMKKAMNYLVETYDADRDGILTGGQHNTLDARWYGKVTWLSLHYTAALRAAAAMADEMGEPQTARQWRELADRGREYIEERLFNGEYFFHEADPEHPESPGVYEGLEYSQLLGQSWAYQVGLGRILDPQKVTTHLRSLWKYNFATDVGPFRSKYTSGRWYAMPGEGGIIACTWPRGGDEALKKGNPHFAGYLNECQPGYEWAATSLLMWHGMPYHALAHTRTMHERYHGSKRNPWNEVEWGDHYSRSMASYGVFTAACGFEYHGPLGYLAFSPRLTPENFKAAFTSAAGWGSFSQTRSAGKQTETIDLRFGTLRLSTLAFDLPADARASKVVVRTPEGELDVRFEQRANRVAIALGEPAVLAAGKQLVVEIVFD